MGHDDAVATVLDQAATLIVEWSRTPRGGRPRDPVLPGLSAGACRA